MPPSASPRENALAEIVSTLEAVTTGASYNYTINKVAQGDGPFFIWLTDEVDRLGHKTVCFVEEGQSSWLPETHDGKYVVTLEVFVQAATKFKPEHPNPFLNGSTTKSQVRSRLIADVSKALLADSILGGTAVRGIEITDDAAINLDGIDADGVWAPSPWVAHELRFEVALEETK